MKTIYPIEEFIEFMEDMMNDLDQLLESPTVEKRSAIKWREDTKKKISTVFGENHPYVREFEAIDFATPFVDGSDKVMFEDTYRLGLEDGKSYLIAMMDELESEYYNVFGMMDIETTFYELGKYNYSKDRRRCHQGRPAAEDFCFERGACFRRNRRQEHLGTAQVYKPDG